MLQKVNTHKIEQLAGSLDQVRRSVEYSNVGLSRELSRLLSSVESEYSEPGVRSAVREVRERLQKMMLYSGHMDDHLRSKVRGLQAAVNQYLQAEKSVLALTKVMFQDTNQKVKELELVRLGFQKHGQKRILVRLVNMLPICLTMWIWQMG